MTRGVIASVTWSRLIGMEASERRIEGERREGGKGKREKVKKSKGRVRKREWW